jgi:hypothetical protein
MISKSAVRAASAFVAATLTMAACTAGMPSNNAPRLSSTAAKCESPSKISKSSDGLEVEAATTGGMTLYGLIQAEPYPFVASPDVKKIVWRAGGSGELAVTVGRPDGESTSLTWGPEYHAASNYDRPGDEYGSGLVTDQPGCWHLRFSRSETGTADVWFEVGIKES